MQTRNWRVVQSAISEKNPRRRDARKYGVVFLLLNTMAEVPRQCILGTGTRRAMQSKSFSIVRFRIPSFDHPAPEPEDAEEPCADWRSGYREDGGCRGAAQLIVNETVRATYSTLCLHLTLQRWQLVHSSRIWLKRGSRRS